MNISTEYGEDKKTITVTVFCNRKPVTKTVTDKATGLTTVLVYKEGRKDSIEQYLFNKVK